MRKLTLKIIFIALTLSPLFAIASGGGVHLDKFEASLEDKESLQRGAKWFTNYCMGCHSVKYSRYERVADDLGIPHVDMMSNLVFADKKIGELMDIAAPEKLGKKWFGTSPPDLTLVARLRSPEWVYTYMRTFYVDPSRPLGVNNKVFKDVGMPHAMLELQGEQVCKAGIVKGSHGEEHADDCATLEHVEGTGLLSPEEYDQVVYDLVNFLEYIAEPSQLERKEIGKWVLFYLLFLFMATYLLNREYWKNIH